MMVFKIAKGGVMAAFLIALAAGAAVPDGPVDGFGADLPLDRVLRQIVPEGVEILIAPDVDPALTVSWEGGPSHKEALKAALAPVKLMAKWGENSVSIEVAPPPPQKWQVFEGETVAQTVLRWSQQAEYTPVPQFAAQEKWRLFVTQTHEGTFEDALNWLSKGFSQQPSKPVFYLGANKTIDIISQPTGTTQADAGQGRF